MALVITTPPPIPTEFPPQPIDSLFNEPPDRNLLALATVPEPPYLVTQPSRRIDDVGNLRSLLPPTWFKDDDQILDAVLATFADSLGTIKARSEWIYQQDRIATASGIWLDMFAEEYFGAGALSSDETNAGWMYRRLGEHDGSYRKRILFELMAQRNTREGMRAMLKFWTGGVEPIIIEPWNPRDTGTFDTNSFFLDSKGYIGSNDDPFTTFIITQRAGGIPVQQFNDETAAQFQTQTPGMLGTDTVSNTNFLYGGLDAGLLFFIDGPINESQVTDIDLYEVLNRTKPAGTKTFVKFLDSQQVPNDPNLISLNLLDYNFVLDESKLASSDVVINLDGIAPPGYYSAFLDANFILDESMLALDGSVISLGHLIPEPLPGFLDVGFYADVNAAL